MAEKEKSGVRGMTVDEQARSFLIFLRHINKLEGSGGGLQDKCREEMRIINDHTDSMTKEPVPITCVWPRRSLEAVLADLRGDGSTEFRPQQPVSPSSLPLCPPSQPKSAYRSFDSDEIPRSNCDEDFVYIIALSLAERDSLSEAGEDSSEEEDDSSDEDYIQIWDGFKDHSIAQIEPAPRRSSRKRMIEQEVSGIGGKLDNPVGELASTTNIPRQVVSLNQNDGVGLKEDRKRRNSGEWTLNLEKRCHGAKKSLLVYKQKNRSSPNSTYNLRSGEKGHNFGIIETPSACPAQLEIKSAGRKGGSNPLKF